MAGTHSYIVPWAEEGGKKYVLVTTRAPLVVKKIRESSNFKFYIPDYIGKDGFIGGNLETEDTVGILISEHRKIDEFAALLAGLREFKEETGLDKTSSWEGWFSPTSDTGASGERDNRIINLFQKCFSDRGDKNKRYYFYIQVSRLDLEKLAKSIRSEITDDMSVNNIKDREACEVKNVILEYLIQQLEDNKQIYPISSGRGLLPRYYVLACLDSLIDCGDSVIKYARKITGVDIQHLKKNIEKNRRDVYSTEGSHFIQRLVKIYNFDQYDKYILSGQDWHLEAARYLWDVIEPSTAAGVPPKEVSPPETTIGAKSKSPPD